MVNWISVIFGAAVGVVVGIPVARFYRAGKFNRGLAVFGILVGGGVTGGLKFLVNLGGSVKFEMPQVLASYATVVALTVVPVLVRRDRRPPPREAEMTTEQWDRLTPRQKIIVRRRLHDKKTSKEVARELGMTEAQVNEEFLRALESAQG